MKDLLEPCPFCGSRAEVLPQQDGFLVICWERCGGKMHVTTSYIEQAIASWNHRVYPGSQTVGHA